MMNERFDIASEKLGSDKAAVRLAGVHAIANLADDWDEREQRQMCIDVLCSYLRMSDPDGPVRPARQGAETGEDAEDGATTTPAPEDHGDDRETRHTILRTIAAHLRRDGTSVSWSGHDFDLRGITIDLDLDLTGAVFERGTVNLDHARFTSGQITFDRAAFSGGRFSFGNTKFIGGTVSFDDARFFSGGTVSFENAQFSDGTVSFIGAKFSGAWSRSAARNSSAARSRLPEQSSSVVRSGSTARGSVVVRSRSTTRSFPGARWTSPRASGNYRRRAFRTARRD